MSFFDWGSDNVSNRSKENLAAWIGSQPCDVPIRHDLFYCLTGHTDTSGNEAFNRQLSSKRAEAVAEYLIELGFPREHVVARGAGSSRRLVPVEGREPQNRRVELYVTRNVADCKKL